VHIYLPRAAGAPQLRQVDAERRLASVREGAAILLVDDDGAVRDVTAAMLRDIGYRVEEANCGEAALDLIGREQFDLAVIRLRHAGHERGRTRQACAQAASEFAGAVCHRLC
jgi:DNA-binding NtrC family response regulator